MAKEQPVTVHGGGVEGGRLQLTTVGEAVTSQRRREKLSERVFEGLKQNKKLSCFTKYVTLHGKTVTKVNARTRHGRTLKQKKHVSTRWLRVSHFPH